MPSLCYLDLPQLCISLICVHGGPWGTPLQPKNGQKRTPKLSIFLCQCSKRVVSLPHIVKSCMQCLYDINPPSLCLGPPYRPSWTVGTLSQPKNRHKHNPKYSIFLCQCSKRVVSFHPIVKSCMQCLYDLNPPSPCQGTPYYQSWTVEDPLTAPKRAETHPKTPSFPLSML